MKYNRNNIVRKIIEDKYLFSFSYNSLGEKIILNLILKLPDIIKNNRFEVMTLDILDKSSLIEESQNIFKFRKTILPDSKFGPINIVYWKEKTNIKKILDNVKYIALGILFGIAGNFIYNLLF